MADITWTHVTNFAAELADVATDARTDILAHVNTCLDVATLGGEDSALVKLARIYLAAHMGTLARPASTGEVAGPVTSESAGALARSYGSIAELSSGALYGSTEYGREFSRLVRPKVAGPLVL